MKYFPTAPHSRDAHDLPLSVSEVRAAIRQGSLAMETLLYPEDGTPPLPAGKVVATPPPLPNRAAPRPARKKGSLAWLWVTLSVLGFCILLTVGGSLAAVHFIRKAEMEVLSERPMAEERKAHQTTWIENDGFEASGAPDLPDEKIFKLIRYPSQAGELAAYLSPDPGDGKKHPVMIWAKGGFGGIGDFLWDEPSRLNDQSARAFREAGIILMCPSYRGENDNPGKFELFYGEVDDFLAAVEYAKTLPYIDTERVYLGGHSTGGSISLLAAATGIECRAVFSFGGEPDLKTVMADGKGYENTPYDIESQIDHQLRSPIRYTNFIKSPTWYIEGGEYIYSNNEAKKMERLAGKSNVPFHALIVEKADHFNILNSSTNLIAKKILADTGETPISLAAVELNSAWEALNGISLTSELTRWMEEGGELAPILDNLETDIAITSFAEISIVESAVTKTLSGTPDENTDIAELAEICDYIEDDDFSGAFVKRIGQALRTYIETNLDKEKRGEIAEANCLRIAGTLALSGDIEIPPLISRLAGEEVGPENDNWDYIFGEIEEQSDIGKALVTEFQSAPPKGTIGEQLLSKVNNLLVEDEDSVPVHPYNSENGAEALAEMIRANGHETFQATLALAFVDEEYRKELLPLVLKHPDKSVRLEAAWVDAKHEGEAGIKILQQACFDLEDSETAKGYLRELKLEDKIPEKANDPDFSAKAKMVKWLSHPTEMGAAPVTIQQIDHHKLFWPPDEEEKDVWLFAFTYRAEKSDTLETNYGMVGGSTWSSFREYETVPGIAELYGHHCALELNWKADDDEKEITEEKGVKILREKNPGKLPD